MQSCLYAFGLILEGDGPAGRLGGESETLPLSERIHFHHRAVGLITEIVAHYVQLLNGFDIVSAGEADQIRSLCGSPNLSSRWKRSECFSSLTPSTAPVP